MKWAPTTHEGLLRGLSPKIYYCKQHLAGNCVITCIVATVSNRLEGFICTRCFSHNPWSLAVHSLRAQREKLFRRKQAEMGRLRLLTSASSASFNRKARRHFVLLTPQIVCSFCACFQAVAMRQAHNLLLPPPVGLGADDAIRAGRGTRPNEPAFPRFRRHRDSSRPRRKLRRYLAYYPALRHTGTPCESAVVTVLRCDIKQQTTQKGNMHIFRDVPTGRRLSSHKSVTPNIVRFASN